MSMQRKVDTSTNTQRTHKENMSNTNSRTKASRTEYLASLRSKLQEWSSPKGSTQKKDDDRYWKPEQDKAGTGSAVIRFLPGKAEEGFPLIRIWDHGFQGPTGKWFIDLCPTSIEEDCPACKANTELWQTGNEGKKKLASSRKRRLKYVSNILVVNDPKHPENNGKVFLYRYGKKIYDKITDLINPPEEFADMPSVDPFDMVEGANFKLRITKQDGFPNYDKSSFDAASPIGDDDLVSEVETKLYSLNEILDSKHFKSFEDLKKRFDMVTGGADVSAGDADVADSEASGTEDEADMPVARPKTTRIATAKTGKTAAPKTTPVVAPSNDEEEDYFLKLASNQS